MTPHLRKYLATLLAAVLSLGLFTVLAPGAEAAVTSATQIRRGQSIGVGGTYTQLANRGTNGNILRVKVTPAGNVVLTNGATVKWAAHTSGAHVKLRVTKTGNIIVTRGTKIIKSWGRHDVVRLVLYSNGVLAARNAASQVVWKTNTRIPSSVTSLVGTPVERTIANAVLVLLNAERAAHGRAPLRMNSALIHSARTHNLAMARANTLSHQLPGEPAFTTRIHNAGYNYGWAGENIGVHGLMTQAAALELEKMMYNEGPDTGDGREHGHYENIVRPEFTNVGIDIYLDTAHHALWLTEDFASPA